jgi:hypothetical protein
MNLSRRTLLSSSALAIGGSLLPYAQAQAAASKEDKSCIFVYLSGGISHIDFTHPGVNVPDEYRSVKGVIDTNSGYQLAGSFTELSKIGDKLSVVRSFTHRDANHSTAAGWVNTGYTHTGVSEGGPLKEPAFGSIVARTQGAMTDIGVPSYIKTAKLQMGGARRDMPAWLGSNYVGFDVDEEGIRNLKLGIDEARGKRRMEMVDFLDKKENHLDKQWSNLRKTAYNIAMGPASTVFDLKRESEATQQLFKINNNGFGKDLLTAIRCVQNGAKFVTVVNGGWDNHGNILDSFNTRGVQLDWGLALLINELERRNLLDKTLVVITTEFGRTPKLNNGNNGSGPNPAGRDHWSNLIPLVFAGGGYTHGRVIGSANDKNEVVSEGKAEPKDLLCTILNHFAVRQGDKVIDSLNRPRFLIPDDARNILS